MPTTPQPGDPTYESWLQMANSYGMTVDQLFESMYPGQTTSAPQAPAPQTPAQPTAPAAGMYEGQQYEGYAPWNPISRMFEGAEYAVGRDIGVQAQYMQNRMDEYHIGLANAKATGVQAEIEFYTNRITETRTEYQALVQKAKTGAGGFRAAGKIASQPGLIGSYGELAEQLPGTFNVDIPLALTEPPGAVEGYDETPTTSTAEGTMTGTAAWQGLTGTAGAAWPGTPSPVQLGQVPENVIASSPFGRVPMNVGAGGVPPPGQPQQYTFEEPAGGGGGGQYPTENFRGFRNWNQMQAVMGEDAGDWFGGTGSELRQYLGNRDTVVGGFGSSSGMRQIQRVDLGQGEQDYYVRRDGMGNIRSFSPVGSHVVNPSSRSQWRGKPYYYREE